MEPEHLELIDRIFQSALDLDPERRPGFLEEVCSGDADLRAEVESLLFAHEQAGNFIEDSASDIAASLIERESLPRQVGPYKIQRLLGAGGMGEVYLATDKLGRSVALKVMASTLHRDPQHVARFLQEAQTVLALNHPNIVTIYDIGEISDTYYISSEFIEGENLREKFETDRLGLDGVLEILIQVATALAAAHEKGVVHRDIKPENVMIRRDGYVKVLDFGIAKLTEDFRAPAATDAPTRRKMETAEGTVVGTASYMSPEQARGSVVDSRTDIWSCGVLLYELVAGEAPFTGGNAVEIIARILEREPLPISHYLPETRPELQRIVSKAMMKNRDDRYQTITEMLLDLKALKQQLDFEATWQRSLSSEVSRAPAVSQDPVPRSYASDRGEYVTKTVDQTVPLSSAEYIVRGIKKHPSILIGVLGVVLFAAISWFFWLVAHRSFSTNEIKSIAVLPFINEGGNSDVEYLSDGMTESLINNLSQLPNLSVKARSSVFRYKGKQVEPQQAASDLSVQAIVNGRLVQRGTDVTLYLELVDARNGDQIWGETYDRKMSELVGLQNDIARDVSQKLRGRLSGAEQQKVSKTYPANAEAYQLYLKGRYHVLKLTLSEIQTGISFFQQAIALDPSYALAYVGLADAYRSALAGDMPPKELLPNARSAAQKAIELDDTLADAHAELGFIIFWFDWDWNAAEREYKRALTLDPNNADAHLFYAHLLSNTGRHAEALGEAKRARELDPLNLRINTLEGQFLIHAGQTDEAIARLQKTFEMDPNYYLAHLFAASAYIEKGMYSEAIAEAEKARALTGPTNSHPVGFLGYALAKSGKQTEARALLDDLIRSSSQRYVSPYNVALIYNGLADRSETLAWLERAYQERDQRIVFLKVEPKWNNLRADPQFQELMRRLGF
ncbi:MAG TPA: protein kinase [Pyrinomonadaceae bacterium]